jgi:hypothetical protein
MKIVHELVIEFPGSTDWMSAFLVNHVLPLFKLPDRQPPEERDPGIS